jgi:acid phosphatase type 7
MKGHAGDAESFDTAKHAALGSNGAPLFGQGDEAYQQVTANGKDDRVVYIVAGASGKASPEGGTLDQPAHVPLRGGRYGLEIAGAVVLAAGRDTLTSHYVDASGNVLDHVVIQRNVAKSESMP